MRRDPYGLTPFPESPVVTILLKISRTVSFEVRLAVLLLFRWSGGSVMAREYHERAKRCLRRSQEVEMIAKTVLAPSRRAQVKGPVLGLSVVGDGNVGVSARDVIDRVGRVSSDPIDL